MGDPGEPGYHHVSNHVVDPKTGFLESNGYALAFDADRKTQFLELYRANGLKCRNACKTLGISNHTLEKHYREDEAFRKAFDDLQRDYAEEVEAASMSFALTPKGVIDRMCQLRRLFPEKYAPERQHGPLKITINLEGKFVERFEVKSKVMDAEIIQESTPENAQSLSLSPSPDARL